jgi:homoprotocatechuate degradation regulator HpaR
MTERDDEHLPYPIPFAETRRTLPFALLRAREAVMERFRPMLKKHDITEQQWRVIRILKEGGAFDAAQLAAQLAAQACVLPPSLTRILKILDGRALVTQERDPTNGRRILVRLSPAGHGLIDVASAPAARIHATIEAEVGRERLAHILNELEFLLDRLK